MTEKIILDWQYQEESVLSGFECIDVQAIPALIEVSHEKYVYY